MDMKRILQAMDGASTTPVEGANDMSKFLQVVTEGTTPHKVTLPVQMAMNHYQKVEPVVAKPKMEGVLKQYFTLVESEIKERVVGGEETPPGINRLTGNPIAPEAPAAAPEPVVPLTKRYDQRYKGMPAPYVLDIDGVQYKFAGREKDGPGTGEIIKVPAGAVGIRGLGAVGVELAKDGMYYIAPKPVDESGRCWDGYKPVQGVKPYAKGSCAPVDEGDEV